MARQLVVRVTLEDISTCLEQLSNNIEVATMRCQVKSRPFVHTTRGIHLKFFAVTEHIVQLCYGFDTFFLAFTHSCMQRCPVVTVFHVRFSSVQHERLCYILALLRILGEQIHHEVKCCLAITVCFVDVCTLFN